jgi:hypothetical protein
MKERKCSFQNYDEKTVCTLTQTQWRVSAICDPDICPLYLFVKSFVRYYGGAINLK